MPAGFHRVLVYHQGPETMIAEVPYCSFIHKHDHTPTRIERIQHSQESASCPGISPLDRVVLIATVRLRTAGRITAVWSVVVDVSWVDGGACQLGWGVKNKSPSQAFFFLSSCMDQCCCASLSLYIYMHKHIYTNKHTHTHTHTHIYIYTRIPCMSGRSTQRFGESSNQWNRHKFSEAPIQIPTFLIDLLLLLLLLLFPSKLLTLTVRGADSPDDWRADTQRYVTGCKRSREAYAHYTVCIMECWIIYC